MLIYYNNLIYIYFSWQSSIIYPMVPQAIA